MNTKLQILINALARIAVIPPSSRGTGKNIAKEALRQLREIEEDEFSLKPLNKISTLDKYKAFPCSCNRQTCKDTCCGQCGCVPCFLSDRVASKSKTTNTNKVA